MIRIYRHSIESQKGAVLFIVVIFCSIVTALMVYMMSQAYQRVRLMDTVSARRTRNYYHAQAGIVDAMWRLRVNQNPSGDDFNTATTTADYYIQIDSDTVSTTKPANPDVHVVIGRRSTTAGASDFGLRQITATGLDAGTGS